MRTASATTIVSRLLLAFAAAEFTVGAVLVTVGTIDGNGLLIGGGCLLFAVSARTWVRRRSAQRLAQEAAPPDRP